VRITYVNACTIAYASKHMNLCRNVINTTIFIICSMRAVVTFTLLGAIAFFVGVGFMLYGAIVDGEPNVAALFIGFTLMFILPLVGLLIDFRSTGRSLFSSGPKANSPIVRAEGGIPEYCPLCHANLGINPPEKCPECETPIPKQVPASKK